MKVSTRNEIIRLHYGGASQTAPRQTAGSRPQKRGPRAGGSRTTLSGTGGSEAPATAKRAGPIRRSHHPTAGALSEHHAGPPA